MGPTESKLKDTKLYFIVAPGHYRPIKFIRRLTDDDTETTFEEEKK